MIPLITHASISVSRVTQVKTTVSPGHTSSAEDASVTAVALRDEYFIMPDVYIAI